MIDANPTQRQIDDAMQRYELRVATKDDVCQWVEQYRLVMNKETGIVEHISFDLRPYLRDIYKDCTTPGNEVWIMKGRQMEISTLIVNCIHYLSDIHPHTVNAQTFPREKTLNNFSSVAIKPMYNLCPEIRKMLNKESYDNLHLKTFTNGSVYFLSFVAGAGKQTLDIRSMAVDSIWMDERDDMPEGHEGQILEAMSHSKLHIINRVGTPKLPGSEFDNGYKASTQKKWHILCECGEEQTLTLKNIMRAKGEYYYGCIRCKKELDRMQGRWQETNPNGIYTGYHINQLLAPWLSAKDILEKRKKARDPFQPYTEREFWNEVMGVTYAGAEKPIEITDLYACLDNTKALGETDGKGPLILGVDWGDHSRYTLLQITRDRKAMLIDTGIWVDEDINAHSRRAIQMMRDTGCWSVMDAGYGKANNQQMMREFPGRAYACYLSRSKSLEPDWRKDALDYRITMDHTMFCEQTINLIKGGLDSFIIPFKYCEPDRPGYDPFQRQKIMDFFREIGQLRMDVMQTDRGREIKYIMTDAHAFASIGYALIMLNEKRRAFKRAKRFVASKGRTRREY